MITTDGKDYCMMICPCGQQNTAGICSHIPYPLIAVEIDPIVRDEHGKEIPWGTYPNIDWT